MKTRQEYGHVINQSQRQDLPMPGSNLAFRGLNLGPYQPSHLMWSGSFVPTYIYSISCKTFLFMLFLDRLWAPIWDPLLGLDIDVNNDAKCSAGGIHLVRSSVQLGPIWHNQMSTPDFTLTGNYCRQSSV